MLLFVVAAFAVGVFVPAVADHAASETHVDADHGPHDGHVVTTDQRAESRTTTLQALPAAPPLFAAQPDDWRAPRPDAADRAPGHPPPKPTPARSPPRSV